MKMKVNSAVKDEVLNWLATGNTGLSSETIAFAACGIDYPDSSYPRDPADFKRCLDMLKACPSITDLSCVPPSNKHWGRFVENWDKMVEMYNEDIAKTPGKCPNLYAFMKQIEAQVYFDEGKVLYNCTYKELDYALKETGIKPTLENCHIYRKLVDEKRETAKA